ncbi:rod shape-determining protein MreD [Vulcanococcus sp.]|jgi:rod shape-determining protein MreD|uniref:rod shape-determining protein MreD n=1 Tax=Vulcanococcus sp. TaxID=2856995 RepID=UPI003C09BA94
MAPLHRQRFPLATALLVPLLTLASPWFLSLDGVGPSWAVLWLLPWALEEGPVSGAIAGLALGLLLDGLHIGSVTEAPALLLLGLWWGRIGRRGFPITRSLNLGLLALVGTAALGATLLLQESLAGTLPPSTTGLQLLLTQALITGVLAPLISSLLLLRWRQLS